eukprot:5201349-Amphidinium_carterae.1
MDVKNPADTSSWSASCSLLRSELGTFNVLLTFLWQVPRVADDAAAVGGGGPPIVGTVVANLPLAAGLASHGVPLKANICLLLT